MCALLCFCGTFVKAAVMAAMDMSILTGDQVGGLVAVLDVGGRTAQCSIIDAGAEVKIPIFL